jgi:hypothetical protein
MSRKEDNRAEHHKEYTTEELLSLDFNTLDLEYDWCPECNGGDPLIITEKRIYITLVTGKKSWYKAEIYACTNGCGFEMEKADFIAEYKTPKERLD